MNTKHYIILIVGVVILFAAPLLIFPNAEYGGADGTASDIITEDVYEPWASPLWSPPSGEIESLLFALQAAIGALIIGYFVGYEKGKRSKTTKNV
jgi:cobalt/nickel transport protein